MLTWNPIGPVPLIPLVKTNKSDDATLLKVDPVLFENTIPNASATFFTEASVAK
ncbi:MAG TPA: hypothetical protein VF884_05930 [Nitrososphaeraceae archaeon]